jgi:glucokinase
MTDTFLGIEIGGSKLQLVAGSGEGVIRERRRFTVDAAGGGAAIRAQIAATLRGWIPTLRPAAVAVGFGGPADWRAGRIARSHQVEGWSDFALGDWLRPLCGVPVIMENDANTAALGEALRGAGRGANPVFYVTLGSGVGGGLVVDGRIYHGAKPGEAEIGHVRLDRTGIIVEERCSGWAVDGKVREAIRREPVGVLAKFVGAATSGEARFLAPALAQGHEEATAILREVAEDLALALSHVTHLFHPEVIVLGGGLSLVGEPLRAAVASALRGFVMGVFAPGPRVELAALGEDAVPVGALLLAAKAASAEA